MSPAEEWFEKSLPGFPRVSGDEPASGGKSPPNLKVFPA